MGEFVRFGIYIAKAAAIMLSLAIVRFWPRNPKKMVFGAWEGYLYSDNPKYLALYILEHTDYKITWVGRGNVESLLPNHKNLNFARMNSLAAAWALLNAKTWVFCQARLNDLSRLPIWAGALQINLWHGIPIKGMGVLSPANVVSPKFHSRFFQRIADFVDKARSPSESWTAISNENMGRVMEECYPGAFSRERSLHCGLPRNDFLINNSTNKALADALKKKYAKILGFDPRRRIVLYLPTWRFNGAGIFAFYDMDAASQAKWKSMMDEHGAVIVEKHHAMTYKTLPPPPDSDVSVVVAPEMQQQIDTQELLLIADILICDYSSAYIDYALLGRPCIHYAPDLEKYIANSGMMYNYADVVAGKITKNDRELMEELRSQLEAPFVSRGNQFSELVEFETGHACEEVTRFIGGHLKSQQRSN